MWPVAIIFVVIAFVAGCNNVSVVYPGDGTPVALDLDGPDYDDFRDDVIANISQAIAIWEPAGPRFQIGGVAQYRIPVHVGTPNGPCSDGTAEGCYDESTGEIWLEAGVGGTGTLASVAAHELGHAIGLKHVAVGIMGIDKVFTSLQPDDIAEYYRVWGAK